jgi:UrcA family protein
MSSHTDFARRILRAVLLAAIVATAAGVPASSFAQSAAHERDTRSIKVRYADLNLATEDGTRILYQRLVAAAERVCPAAGKPAELRQNRTARSCINAAVQDAVKQVRNPQLAQVAASRMR